MEDIKIKPAFEERYRNLLGREYDRFISCSLSFLRRSIRVNTLKISIEDLKHRLEQSWKLTPVPWCKEGFFIEGERRDIGNLKEHALGYFYVQEAASMIPAIVLGPQPGETILDMCASPGSKTTQIAAMMQNTGALIANDIKADRIKPLGINLQRCGVMNARIVMGIGQRSPKEAYDRVLVDAPCSGTGNIRRSLKTLKIWNPLMIRRLSKTQIQLIEAGFSSLKPGGTMVYSTCSTEPEEDEAVVSQLIERHPDAELEKIELKLVSSAPITSFEGLNFKEEVKNAIRLWPQDNDTEGFFIARIRKTQP